MLNSAINWFEIPATDFDRALKFYSAIYASDLPHRDTGTALLAFLPHEQGNGIGGAIACGDGYKPSADGAKIFLNAGDDLAVMLARVEDAGGIVHKGKYEIAPGIGYCALVEDTEGNHIYLHSMN